ncbi:GntR family transcriptional regulator [Nocardia carnea]|uniref:GntR family transcriptional regulator n=1 Tax=Nocardia carnea TaxID=37328 RepID=UPI003D7B722C
MWLREILPEKVEGDLLPTVAEICERFDVSGVQTVRDGYRPLIDEGWVRVQQRPQRRWVVAKVPSRVRQPDNTSAMVARVDRVETALRGVLRELDSLRADISRPESS